MRVWRGIYIMLPFLGIHARTVLDRPASYLGFLLMVHTCGSIAGNLVGGALGDRFGGKLTTALSQIGFVAIGLWALSPADRSSSSPCSSCWGLRRPG